MSKFKERPCRFCGQGTIALRNARDMVAPYRDEPAVRIEEDVRLPICDKCGEMLLNAEYTEAYEAALRKSYERLRLEQQRREIARALEALHASQADLERMLGLSAGYVSKLLRGEKLTSATTVRFLHVLSSRPDAVRFLADVAPVPEEILAQFG